MCPSPLPEKTERKVATRPAKANGKGIREGKSFEIRKAVSFIASISRPVLDPLSTVSLSRSLRTPVSLSGLRALTYSIACCRAHPHPCTLTLCTSCHARSCASSPLSGLASRLRVCGVGGSLASDPAPKVGCSCRAAHTHGHAAPALAPLWPLLGLGQHNARGAPADRFTSSPISP
jgi:hypothetical protein